MLDAMLSYGCMEIDLFILAWERVVLYLSIIISAPALNFSSVSIWLNVQTLVPPGWITKFKESGR